MQHLFARVSEQLTGGRVGGNVAHLLVGHENRDRRVLDRLS
jgi:hypothetical protein